MIDWVIRSGVTNTRKDGSVERTKYGSGSIFKIPGHERCELQIRAVHGYERHLKYLWEALYDDLHCLWS